MPVFRFDKTSPADTVRWELQSAAEGKGQKIYLKKRKWIFVLYS